MNAELRFTDGETRSFVNVRGIDVRGDTVIVRRWFRVIAIVPVHSLRWARLVCGRKISQRDFGKPAL